MAICQMCGNAVPAPGLTFPGPCHPGCPNPKPGTAAWFVAHPNFAPAPHFAPVPHATNVIRVNEHLDSHHYATFTIPAGSVTANSEWKYTERLPPESTLLVREILATVSGGAGDVDLVLDSGSVQLIDVDNCKSVFERPLGVLTIMDTRNRNAETEERLGRLERMMNVLVEQETPAGEALRRLGGSKITYESPTKLALPALFDGGRVFGICLGIHDSLTLLNDVIVRISIIGISKRPVAK